MTEVVLIHAGATAYDDQRRLQGNLDLPLSLRGVAEISALVPELASLDIAAIYSGPDACVAQSAELIARGRGLRTRRVDELRNIDLGLWQGLLHDEVRRRNGRLYRLWLDDPRAVCPPRGEFVQHALGRIRQAVRPLIKRHRDEMIGLVASRPLAYLISAFLHGCGRIAWDPERSTAAFERIAVSPDVLVNGDHA